MGCSRLKVLIILRSKFEPKLGERILLHAGEVHTMWKSIWSMQTPAVVKNFLWKVGNDLLPNKSNLLKKRISKTRSASPICFNSQKILSIFSGGVRLLWRFGKSVAKKSRSSNSDEG
jgi:hypothetical protein